MILKIQKRKNYCTITLSQRFESKKSWVFELDLDKKPVSRIVIVSYHNEAKNTELRIFRIWDMGFPSKSNQVVPDHKSDKEFNLKDPSNGSKS
jgi:hypothetical protein